MNYRRIEPNGIAAQWVVCYWIVESDDVTPHEQKIIPDGFPEIIFHFGDAYQTDLSGAWAMQEKDLLAGQIRKYFYLRNTGRSSIFGIKLQPTALTSLFQFDLSTVTDKVLTLEQTGITALQKLCMIVRAATHMNDRVALANDFFCEHSSIKPMIAEAIEWIFKTRGRGTVQELSKKMNANERQVERLFQKYVGLSPKFYCRIVRFNAIFQLLVNRDPSWAELAYEAGYADQSHFIRNFKAFTGEEPSAYGFDEKTLANFFLNK